MSRWHVVWSLSEGCFGGSVGLWTVAFSQDHYGNALKAFCSSFHTSQTLCKGSLFTFLDEIQVTLESLLNEHHRYSSMARLSHIDLCWIPLVFFWICAFQQGLSKAAEWGDGLWSEALASREHSWIHSLPTCPSLTPSSFWAPGFSPPGSPCLLRNCELCTFPALNALFFGLHSSYTSFHYKAPTEYYMPFFAKYVFLYML